MKVTARVQRSGDWWAIEVPEIEGVFTQARRLDQVADTVADAVCTMLNLDDSSLVEVEVVPEIDEGLRRMVDQAVLASAQASAAQDEASKATRQAVAVLRDQGLPVRDVAELLHVSHQRVSQLAKSVKVPNVKVPNVKVPDVSIRLNAPTRKEVSNMAKGDIDTYHEDGQWKNKVEGSGRAANVHETKAEAQAKGREMAKDRKVEHVIKKKDGTIGGKNSYGNDPKSSKG